MLKTKPRPPRGLSDFDLAGPVLSVGLKAHRRIRKSLVLAQSSADAGTATGTARARIYTPSTRLRLAFGLGFLPIGGTTEQPTIPVTSVWTATPALRDPTTGRYMVMQDIFASQPLPDTYEVDSAANRIDIVATLAHVASTLGHWILVADWEPNTLIDDAELAGLFASCDLQSQGAVLTLST